MPPENNTAVRPTDGSRRLARGEKSIGINFRWSVPQLVQDLAVTQAVLTHIVGSNPTAPATFKAQLV